MTRLWARAKHRSKLHHAASAIACLTLALLFPTSALAQDAEDKPNKSNAWSTETLTQSPSAQALNMNGLTDRLQPLDETQSVVGVSPVLKDALFELPSDMGSPLFRLDFNNTLCLDSTQSCREQAGDQLNFDFTRDFSRRGIGDVDLSLTPHAGVYKDDNSSSALVGALVKIGDNLVSEDNIKPNTWYLFAGADAQAVTFTPGSDRNNRPFYTGEFSYLEDRIIVGDAQAGVAYRLGDADLSLTYLRRQAKAENYKFEENAAALSLTWRR